MYLEEGRMILILILSDCWIKQIKEFVDPREYDVGINEFAVDKFVVYIRLIATEVVGAAHGDAC